MKVVVSEMSEENIRLVVVRHGDSVWSVENRFCGWHDADLSEKGTKYAYEAAQAIKDAGFSFDMAFTSVLKRAIKTLFVIQDVLDLHWIPVTRSWRLNERMYGGLQGYNKSQVAAKYGEDQVKTWRRSYDVPPPPMSDNDPELPANDPKYGHLDLDLLPKSECFKDTFERFLPFWNDQITPLLKNRKHVLIVAHGTILRSIYKHMRKIPNHEIGNVNIPTGIPLVFELDAQLRVVNDYYLSSEARLNAAIDDIVRQGRVDYKNS